MSLQRVYTVEAIIIKRKNFGESDRILTVFTKQTGKLRILAKGIRRINSRRGGHVEIFRYVRLTLHRGKLFDLLSEAQMISDFDIDYRDLISINCLYYLCEITDSLTGEGQRQEDIFYLLKDFISAVVSEKSTAEKKNIIHNFAQKLLRQLGFMTKDRHLSFEDQNSYIERIIEKHLRSPQILQKLFPL